MTRPAGPSRSASHDSAGLMRSLQELGRGDAAEVGCKAETLGRLLSAGLPVPPGVVLTTAAFPGTQTAPNEVPPWVRQVLAATLDGFAVRSPLAVRSSGVTEDLAGASWAGQYESVLGVEGASELEAAVLACWRSAYAPRARVYGGREVAPLAVLIQELVAATSAGVAFTADPVTGANGVTVIEAVRGLGDRLVSGEVSPERWRLVDGRAERVGGDETVLDVATARRIDELARQAEAVTGRACDVEWAFDGARVWLLQSRPITTLVAEPIPIDEEPPPGVWHKDDHHAVLSPFTRSLFVGLEDGLAELFHDCGMPVEGMTYRSIRGSIYFRMVPLGGKDGPTPPRWLMWVLSRLMPSLRRANARAKAWFAERGYVAELERWRRIHRPALRAASQELRQVELQGLSEAALLRHFDRLVAHLERGGRIHGRLAVAEMIAYAELSLVTEDWLGWEPHAVFGLLAGHSPGSTADARSLKELVERYEGDRPAILEQPVGRHTRAGLAEEAPALSSLFEAWLREHGVQQLDYDARHPTLLERPEVALAALGSAFSDRLESAERAASSGREALLGRALDELGDGHQRETFVSLLAGAQLGREVRDDNALETFAVPMGLLRLCMLEIGRRARAAGNIGCTDDVFYLELEEIAPFIRGQLPNAVELIARRRGEYVWALANPGPPAYGEPEPPPPVSVFPAGLRRIMRAMDWVMRMELDRGGPTDDGLTGIAGGGGRYTGPVRVIAGPEEFGKVRPGDVVVCRVTTTTWTMLFPVAGAIVTDEGGALSHAAIVARELCLPAVLGTSEGTRVLADGQTVTVDGDRGVVRLPRHSPSDHPGAE